MRITRGADRRVDPTVRGIDTRLVIAVLHNNDLNQMTWEMRAMGGSPQFAAPQTLPNADERLASKGR